MKTKLIAAAIMVVLAGCQRIDDPDPVVCFRSGKQAFPRHHGQVDVRFGGDGYNIYAWNRAIFAVAQVGVSARDLDVNAMDELREFAASIGGNGIIFQNQYLSSDADCFESKTGIPDQQNGKYVPRSRFSIVRDPNTKNSGSSPFFDIDPEVRFGRLYEQLHKIWEIGREVTPHGSFQTAEVMLAKSISGNWMYFLRGIQELYRLEETQNISLRGQLISELWRIKSALSWDDQRVIVQANEHGNGEYGELFISLKKALRNISDQLDCELGMVYSR